MLRVCYSGSLALWIDSIVNSTSSSTVPSIKTALLIHVESRINGRRYSDPYLGLDLPR